MRRRLLPLLLPAFLSVAWIDGALAACTGMLQAQPDIAPGFSLFTTYDPTRAVPTTVTTTFTVVPAQGMSPPCAVYVVVAAPTGMKDPGWTRSLTYSFGGDIANAVSFGSTSGFMIQLNNGISQTFTASITIPPKQNHPPQTLSEIIELRMYSSQGQFLRTTNFMVAATVIGSCALPAPSVANLNFSGGIVGGTVNNAYTLSTLIQGASCSSAAKLILRGAPMKTNGSASAQFDNVIHYRATAKLGAAASVLATDVAAESIVTLPPITGTVSVEVSLIAKGKPLVAGTYSSVLSVVLEPAN